MTVFHIGTLLVSLAAFFAFVNLRFLRLPMTIGIMLVSLSASLSLILAGNFDHGAREQALKLVSAINFNNVVLHGGMLAFLLFAGSIHLDLSHLRREQGIITVLSLGGTMLSTLLVGGLIWAALRALALGVPVIDCMLFGALISPTDPIAVLGIVKRVGASEALQTQLSGESLFNDGVGVVIFLTLGEAASAAHPTFLGISWLLIRETAGGAGVGLASGIVVFQLLKMIDDYQVEVLLTLALAMGSYALAEIIHVSAPIAVVVAGLFIGNLGWEQGMSQKTREQLDVFWELIDNILNAVLFLMIGLQLLATTFSSRFFVAGAAATVVALAARWLSVWLSVRLVGRWRAFERGAIGVLTWGGLRGGLSIAMALSLPNGAHRDLIVFMTYVVVVFSVFGQGLTLAPFIRATTQRGD